MPRAITCPKCGKVNTYRARRCLDCGQRFIRTYDELFKQRPWTLFGLPFVSGCLPLIIIFFILGIFLCLGRI